MFASVSSLRLAHLKVAATGSNAKAIREAALPDKEVGTYTTRKREVRLANATEDADPSDHPMKTRIRDDKQSQDAALKRGAT